MIIKRIWANDASVPQALSHHYNEEYINIKVQKKNRLSKEYGPIMPLFDKPYQTVIRIASIDTFKTTYVPSERQIRQFCSLPRSSHEDENGFLSKIDIIVQFHIHN